MKFDQKGIETALEAFLDCGFSDGPDDDKRYMENGIRAYLEATGSVIVPVEPTNAMHDAARDWSHERYGKPIGIDASYGCWRAMLRSSQESE